MKIAILGYKTPLVPPWDPSTCNTGLPGSEECVVYAAQELADRGHEVSVYMNTPPDSQYRIGNPKWLDVEDYLLDNSMFDIVFQWRRYDSVARCRGKKVFMWVHDSPGPTVGDCHLPDVDGILVLSQHHLRQFESNWSQLLKLPHAICGNGFIPDQFQPRSRTNKHSIGYYSNYSRGLIILLSIWPKIHEAYPDATLDICYGRETWGTMPIQLFNWTIERIEEYADKGVRELGCIGHKPLANLMCQTSVWCYPCIDMGETFCITAVKCQAAGMIPITTRIAALNETVHPNAPQIESFAQQSDIDKYLQLVLDTLNRADSEDRQKYIDYAKQFSWSACIDKWLAFYEKIAE